MIHELPRHSFGHCERLISDAWLNSELHSIISGMTPGRVFADSVENPRVALVWSPGLEGFFLTGDSAAESFLRELANSGQSIEEQVRSAGADCLEFSGDSPAWDSVIPRVWSGRGLSQSKQYARSSTPSTHSGGRRSASWPMPSGSVQYSTTPWSATALRASLTESTGSWISGRTRRNGVTASHGRRRLHSCATA